MNRRTRKLGEGVMRFIALLFALGTLIGAAVLGVLALVDVLQGSPY